MVLPGIRLLGGYAPLFTYCKRGVWYEKKFKEFQVPTKWTLPAVQAEANKYKTRGEFAKGSPNAYAAAFRQGWLEKLNLPKTKWTKQAVFDEATRYHSRTAFSKGCHPAYLVARKNNWLNKLFPHDLRRRTRM